MSQRVVDFLRLALACLAFVVIEPMVQDILDWPFPIPQILAVGISSLVAWIFFEVASPVTTITIGWHDARGISFEGSSLDLEPKSGAQARVYRIHLERSSPGVLGRAILAILSKRDFRVTMDANQHELTVDIQNIGVQQYASHEGDGIAFRFGKSSHPATAASTDIALDWTQMAPASFRASLRYRAVADGALGWLLARLVLIKPKTTTIRKIAAIV